MTMSAALADGARDSMGDSHAPLRGLATGGSGKEDEAPRGL
jgi:hypothetical protein